jgi:hypothetical protein
LRGLIQARDWFACENQTGPLTRRLKLRGQPCHHSYKKENKANYAKNKASYDDFKGNIDLPVATKNQVCC